MNIPFSQYDDLIIWGAGNMGRHIQHLLDDRPLCFWDTNANANKNVPKDILGVNVLAPFSNIDHLSNPIIIVAIGDKTISTRICNELQDRGIDHMAGTNAINQIYKCKLSNFCSESFESGKKHVLLVGDSIIEQFAINKYRDSDSCIYHNRGIAGDTIIGLLGHLDCSFYGNKMDKIFLCIGTNDLNQDSLIEDMIVNTENVLNFIRDKHTNTETHIISLLPVNETDNFSYNIVQNRRNSQIIRFNVSLFELCSKLNFSFLNIFSNFLDDKGQLSTAFTEDGVHLNEKGYSLLNQILDTHLI